MADIKNKSVSIYIDETAAEQALVKLQAQADKLNQKIEAGRTAGKNMTAELKKLDTVNASIKSVTDQLANGLAPTLVQQQNLVRNLRNELSRMSANDPAFNEKLELYKKQNTVLTEMRGRIDGVKESSKEMGGVLGAIGEEFLKFFAVAAIIEKIKEFFSDSVEEANKAELAYRRLLNILTNIGRVDAFGRLKEKAEDLSKQFGLFKADEVTEVFQKLITYGKLTENQINQLTPVIINFAEKEGIDLPEATSKFIKAMEGNKRALLEYGINIKDAHSETERFGIILDTVKGRVEGAAQAFGETTAGQIKKTETEISELKEEIGTNLQPAIKWFYQSVSDAIKGVPILFEDMGNGLSNFLLTMKVSATAAWEFMKGGTAGAANYMAGVVGKLQSELEVQHNTNAIASTGQLAKDIAAGAAKTTIDAQEKLLASNIAILKSDQAALKQLVDQGKANNDEAKKLRLQIIGDNQIIQQLQESIEVQKDPRVLGQGGTGLDNYKELVSAAEEFNKKVRDLHAGAANDALNADDKEVADAQHKYDELFESYKKLQEKIAGSGIKLEFNLDDIKNLETSDIAGIIQKQAKALVALSLKNSDEQDKKAYQEDLARADQHAAALKKIEADRYASGETDAKEYENNITEIDNAAVLDKIQIAHLYATTVTEAAAAITAFEALQLDKQVKNELAAAAKKEANRKALIELDKQTALQNAQAQLALTSNNSVAQVKAQENLLAVEHSLDIQALEEKRKTMLLAVKEDGDARAGEEQSINEDINQQLLDSDAFFEKKRAQLHRQGIADQINMYIGFASTVADVYDKFNQALSSQENARLQTETASNNAQKTALQQQLNSKLISQNTFNQKSLALDADLDAKKQLIEKRQFERQKALQIAQTLINGAAGIIKLWVDPGFPEAIPMALILGAATLAEVAAIAATKPAFAFGGRVGELSDGRINTSQNIPTQANGDNVLATVRTGEVILNARQQAALGGDATFRAIGVPGFGSGGYTAPKWFSTPYIPVNYAAAAQSMHLLKFATGGIAQAAAAGAGSAAITDPALLEALQQSNAINIATMQTLAQLSQQLKTPFAAIVSLKQLSDAQAQLDTIQQNAQFKG